MNGARTCWSQLCASSVAIVVMVATSSAAGQDSPIAAEPHVDDTGAESVANTQARQAQAAFTAGRYALAGRMFLAAFDQVGDDTLLAQAAEAMLRIGSPAGRSEAERIAQRLVERAKSAEDRRRARELMRRVRGDGALDAAPSDAPSGAAGPTNNPDATQQDSIAPEETAASPSLTQPSMQPDEGGLGVSDGLFWSGIGATALGVPLTAIGVWLASISGEGSERVNATGVAFLAPGIVLLAVGIPLLTVGALGDDETSDSSAELRIGPGMLTAQGRF